MSAGLLALIAFDLVVLAVLAMWFGRRRGAREEALRRRVAELESGHGLSTAAALERARAQAPGGVEPVAGTAEAAVLASIRQVRPAAPGDEVAAAEILSALRAGQTIDAIKRYRQATGLGLKEAKDVIDHVRDRFNV